ncbi:MAG TPA: NAD(P)-dependent alcohol dehydrogenase [Candidatus Thermoplasmatota archaeon]|nr:NAD(P)-dependent alcohol dehydrogenase [Candidatus Thermoplasmatota archaeon]
MQAYLCRRYGGVDAIDLAEVPDPVPAEHEVLVRIHATTVTAGDWRVRTLEVPQGLGLVARLAIGFSRPRQPILGTELAGIVEAVGAHVTRFRPGDAVFAFPGEAMGAHAELRAIAEDGPIAPKPANLSMEDAAALPFGGATALDFLRKVELRPRERILVVGASGNVGTALVQLAKRAGAHITAVASGANEDLVRSLGADRFVDYTREPYLDGRETYDVIADTAGVDHGGGGMGGALLLVGAVALGGYALWNALRNRKDSELEPL